MYNEEKKNKFFEYCLTNNKYGEQGVKKYQSYFNVIGVYEEAVGKDVSDMVLEDIINMFANCKIFRLSYIRTIHSVLKQYVEWVNKERGGGINFFTLITPKEIAGMFKDSTELINMYFSEEEFDGYLNTIRARYDFENAAYFIALLLVMYENICPMLKDIVYLKADDVDVQNLTVRKMPVSPRTIDALDKVYNLTSVKRAKAGCSDLNYGYSENSIFKWNVKSTPKNPEKSFEATTRRYFRTELQKVADRKKITPKSLYDCGLIHFVYRKYLSEGYLKDEFVEKLESGELDYQFNRWISQRSSMGLTNFKNRYLDIIDFCL